ncbi:hypothetical protein WOLCODRAFT_164581 [Wolfiporia cocos MD-104 SS10]|uniref:Uncharacterized protein n=1 Tax=Wolfiporia cocos (strain MD-104) TaxID=742152 RepID=A0A2H3JN50_WOLCO|nr:hypothetical protein WOLCODRAFT_164581 [Wolfiporia cocos MD-104 SS10]
MATETRAEVPWLTSPDNVGLNPLTDPIIVTPPPLRETRIRPTTNRLNPELSTSTGDASMCKQHRTTARCTHRIHKIARDTISNAAQHWMLALTLIMAAVISISIAVGWSLRIRPVPDEGLDDTGITLHDNEIPYKIELGANLIEVDTDKQTLTVDWRILNSTCPSDCPTTKILIDSTILSDSSGSSTGGTLNDSFTSVYTYNRSFVGRDLPIFRTKLIMTNFESWGGRSAQMYPFDRYTTRVSMSAITVDGEHVALEISGSGGIAVGFNVELQNQHYQMGNRTGLMHLFIVTRAQVIRVYAILIVMAIWLITLTFIMACVTSVFFGKGIKGEVLVLPVATLFAFTQLRSSLPGAPSGFGAEIDFVGILPCLALLTFSAVLMCAIFLFRDPEKDTSWWREVVGKSSQSV